MGVVLSVVFLLLSLLLLPSNSYGILFPGLAEFNYSTFDQFVMEGCKLVTASNGDVVQECNGNRIPQIVFNKQEGGSFFGEASVGSITGAKAVGGGMLWVQNPERLFGLASVEVCESKGSMYGVKESCKRISAGTTSNVFSEYSSVLVEEVVFDPYKDGSDRSGIQNGLRKGVHGGGYFYPLFSKDCPYQFSLDPSKNSSNACAPNSLLKPGFDESNSCYLLSDSISSTCSPDSSCPCDSTHGCSTNFQPTDKNPLKDNSSAKACYDCRSAGRRAMGVCVSDAGNPASIASALKEATSEDVRALIRRSYGVGKYVCAYFVSPFAKAIRAGCVKSASGIGPRPYPRIAKSSDNLRLDLYPAAHLFLNYPFVIQFRDDDVPATKCDDGKAEIGEDARGTFFRPKIKVSLSDAVRVITFTPKPNTSMETVYGATKFTPGGVMRSGWNETIPFTLQAADLDNSDCTYQPLSYNAFICTRIEYDDSAGEERYVAYHAPSLLGTSSTTQTCAALESANKLVLVGSVKRPPLKYSVDPKSKNIVLPLNIVATIVGSDKRYPVKVGITPSLSHSDTPGYHDDIPKMEVEITPTRYDPVLEKVAQGTDCVMLFNHKVCIAEDECSSLDYIDSGVRAQSDLSTCTTAKCKIYNSLSSKCERRTFCERELLTIRACQSNHPAANVLELKEKFSGYTAQDQWLPSVCLTPDSIPILPPEMKRLYGDFGGQSLEGVVEMFDPDTGRSGYALRTFEKSNFSIMGNIMPVTSEYFVKHSIDPVIAQTKVASYEYGDSVAKTFFGDNCNDDCIKSRIRVRPRTIRELGGCLNFTSAFASSISIQKSWDPTPMDGPMSDEHEIVDTYIPLACPYLHLAFQGPGGGGARNRSNGTTGGGGRLVFDAMAQGGTEFLRIIRARAGQKFSISNAFGDVCYSVGGGGGPDNYWGAYIVTDMDYHAVGILTPYQEIAYGYGGLTTIDMAGPDCNHEPLRGTASMDPKYFVQYPSGWSELTAKDPILGPSGSSYGVFNGHAAESSPGFSSGVTGNDIKNGAWLNMYLDDSVMIGGYGGRAWRTCGEYIIVCTYHVYHNEKAGNGFAYIRPARAGSDGSMANNGYGNIVLRVNSPEDKHCISMCPRMSMKTKIGTKDAVCEYGGSISSALGVQINSLEYDNQVPVGVLGMPTHCTDENGVVYIPGSESGLQKCPSGTTPYTGNDKLYGFCVFSNSESVAKRELFADRHPYVLGSGIYCGQDKDCVATRYWDVASTRGMVIERSLSGFTNFARKCLPGGHWSVDTGATAHVPMYVLSKARYLTIPPYVYTSPAGRWGYHNSVPVSNAQPYNYANLQDIDPDKVSKLANDAAQADAHNPGPKIDLLLDPQNEQMFASYNADCPYIGQSALSCRYDPNAKVSSSYTYSTNCYLFLHTAIDTKKCGDESVCQCNSGKFTCDADYMPSPAITAIPTSTVPLNNDEINRAKKIAACYVCYAEQAKIRDSSSCIIANISMGMSQSECLQQRCGYRSLCMCNTATVKCGADGLPNPPIAIPDPIFPPSINAVPANEVSKVSNCFACYAPIRRAFDRCVKVANQSKLSQEQVVQQQAKQAPPKPVTSVPSGHARGMTINDKVNALRPDELRPVCPALDSNRVPYEPLYSLNAIWPQTEGGLMVQPTACKDGYISHSGLMNMNRLCSPLGIWKGLPVGGDKPCLYSCPPDEDIANAIKWNTPGYYSSAKSVPTCMTGQALVMFNGVKQMKDVQNRFPAGVDPMKWARNCNMPAAADPYLYGNVSPDNPDGKLPYWDPKPAGAHCVPATFAGECIGDRYACFDSGVDGQDAIGHCVRGMGYFANGISTSPPTPRVNDISLLDYTPTNAYTNISTVTIDCTFNSSPAQKTDLSRQLPFLSFKTTLNSGLTFFCSVAQIDAFFAPFESEPNYGFDYKQTMPDQELRLLGTFSNQGVLDLESKIKNDVAFIGEDCQLQSSHALSKKISTSMSAYGFCASLCFNSKQSKFEKYSCDDTIPADQDLSTCAQVCTSDAKTYYYSYASGITESSPSAGGQVWSLSTSNNSSCLGRGLPKAMIAIRQNDSSLTERVGTFCKKVTYRTLASLDRGVFPIPVNDSIFDGKFDASQKACYVPRSCRLPNGATVMHADIQWIGIGDDALYTDDHYRFSHSATPLTGGKIGFRVTTENAFLLKLGCVDGELFLLDMTEGLGCDIDYTLGGGTKTPSDQEYVKYSLAANPSKFADITIETPANFVEKMTIDTTTPIAYYLSLRRMSDNHGNVLHGDILRDELGNAKTLNSLKSQPAQVQDYTTVKNGAGLSAIFSGLNASGAVKIISKDNLFISLAFLPGSPPTFNFATWVKGPVSYRLDFAQDMWNIVEIRSSAQGNSAYLAAGSSDFDRTDYVLDFTPNRFGLGDLIRSGWGIMCSPSSKDCVIKSHLTGMFIDAQSTEGETVRIQTTDIARAAKFTISN